MRGRLGRAPRSEGGDGPLGRMPKGARWKRAPPISDDGPKFAGKSGRSPVSRILCLPPMRDSMIISLPASGGPPERTATNTRRFDGRAALLLFCLAPCGVCLARSVTLPAVGSYPTFSPLPEAFGESSWRFVFCGTFRPGNLAVARPSLSRGALPCGVRTFLGPAEAKPRSPGERRRKPKPVLAPGEAGISPDFGVARAFGRQACMPCIVGIAQFRVDNRPLFIMVGVP